MEEREILSKLRTMISEERLNHSIRVKDTAVNLAIKYNENIYKASIAALVHDCAKDLDKKQMLGFAKIFNIKINSVYEKQIDLLHAPVGAFLALKEFDICDKEILHAIEVHTTGCENMNMLDKIIYIADYIEPSRNFKGVEILRKITFTDIDKGVLFALNNTIKYILEKERLIDINTIKARNYLLSENNK